MSAAIQSERGHGRYAALANLRSEAPRTHAARTSESHAIAIALVGGIVAVIIIVLTALGMEARGVSFEPRRPHPIRKVTIP